eukprot:10136383-Karenia_brevis.AAC.1
MRRKGRCKDTRKMRQPRRVAVRLQVPSRRATTDPANEYKAWSHRRDVCPKRKVRAAFDTLRHQGAQPHQ